MTTATSRNASAARWFGPRRVGSTGSLRSAGSVDGRGDRAVLFSAPGSSERSPRDLRGEVSWTPEIRSRESRGGRCLRRRGSATARQSKARWQPQQPVRGTRRTRIFLDQWATPGTGHARQNAFRPTEVQGAKSSIPVDSARCGSLRRPPVRGGLSGRCDVEQLGATSLLPRRGGYTAPPVSAVPSGRRPMTTRSP